MCVFVAWGKARRARRARIGGGCRFGGWVRFFSFSLMARVGTVWRALALFGACGLAGRLSGHRSPPYTGWCCAVDARRAQQKSGGVVGPGVMGEEFLRLS